MAAKKTSSVDFEKSLRELEDLVEQMEKGELSLEESLKHFERGMELTHICQSALQAAEAKVEKLMIKEGHATVGPFDSQAD